MMSFVYTILYYFEKLPLRIFRLLKHFTGMLTASAEWSNAYKTKRWYDWLIHLGLYLLDIFAFPEIYELLMMLFKWNTRPISTREKNIIQSIFKNHLNYNLIKLDNKAVIGPKRFKFAYVSFNTINCFGKIRDEILVHECTHIWQFQHLGSIYIYEALKAQYSEEKYDYGGVEGLYVGMTKGKKFLHYNFEQQGDIVEDYYCLQQEINQNQHILSKSIYEYFVKQLDIKYYTKP